MDRLTLDLENCYGIKKLEANLDFSRTGAIAIYAPNGAMKTSLAETFRDIAQSQPTRDRIFVERVTKREVKDEGGNDLLPASLVVLKSLEQVLPNDGVSTLLVSSDLRSQYESLLAEVGAAKARLLKSLKKVSGSKKDIESEVSRTFTTSGADFLKAIARIKDELESHDESSFTNISYDLIFDEKTIKLLQSGDIRTAIEAYVRSYNQLLDSSKYFKRGVFNYYNASTIAKNLADNGFFRARHTVRLSGSDPREISDVAQLEQIIQEERDSITSDAGLRQTYHEIERNLNKNQDLRDLHRYLSENEHVLPHLSDLATFKENVWKTFLKLCIEQVKELLALSEVTKDNKRQLEDAAKQERTVWEDVVDVFNDRFTVPFELSVVNRESVMLGEDKVAKLGFTFNDGRERKPVESSDLAEALSTGERKAFYMLNVMFDIEARLRAGKDTLFVFDDIADSFDYKNKYAIIEYLRDIAEHAGFRQLLLTHNFDFFRTACSKFVRRENCLMAVKTTDQIELVDAYGVNNVFKFWKENFFRNDAMKIASIPFMRNLVEYTGGTGSAAYMALTGMVHVVSASQNHTVADLDSQYNQLFGTTGSSSNAHQNLRSFILQTADACAQAPQGINFENKIVLSIAIRLVAEQFIISRLNDPVAVSAINTNQTNALCDLFRMRFRQDPANSTLRKVLLMTPESLHLNSFMYEPIVDMSDDELRRLYQRVLAL